MHTTFELKERAFSMTGLEEPRMWGNPLGWGISAVWSIVVVGLLVFLSHALDTVSEPTPFSRTSGAADVITLPVPLGTVMPGDAGQADPAALYRQAIQLYQADHATFDKFAANAMTGDLKVIEPAVALLREAAGSAIAPVFASDPADVIQYNSDKPALNALSTLGNCALNLGLRTKPHDKAAAKKDYEAGLCLGARLAGERLCYSEFSNGLGMLTGGARALANLVREEGDAPRADALEQFADQTEDFAKQKIVPIEAVLSSIDQNIVEAHAGDVFFIARNSKERMWRVEAALALGRYKYDAGRRADNNGALKIATDIAQNDPDPIVKLAASMSRDLTAEQMRMLH